MTCVDEIQTEIYFSFLQSFWMAKSNKRTFNFKLLHTISILFDESLPIILRQHDYIRNCIKTKLHFSISK